VQFRLYHTFTCITAIKKYDDSVDVVWPTDCTHCLWNDTLFVSGVLNIYYSLINLLLTDDKFQQLQQMFLDRHYAVFEEAEENKLIYTDIHKEYVIILTDFQSTVSFDMTRKYVCVLYHIFGDK